MKKIELLELFKQQIEDEYNSYFNSLFNKDKSELVKEDSIEEIYYIQKFKNIALSSDSNLEVEFLLDIEDILKKHI